MTGLNTPAAGISFQDGVFAIAKSADPDIGRQNELLDHFSTFVEFLLPVQYCCHE